jgi:hypothetical protein
MVKRYFTLVAVVLVLAVGAFADDPPPQPDGSAGPVLVVSLSVSGDSAPYSWGYFQHS